MFLGKVDHPDFVNGVNAFRVELYECAEVNFHFHGKNIASFSRLFCIMESDGRSYLSQLNAGRQFTFKAGGIYFASSSDELFMHFVEGTHFFSFHFDTLSNINEELFFQAGLLVEELGNEEWIQSISELLRGEANQTNIFLLKARLLEKVSNFLAMRSETESKDFLRNRDLHDFFRNKANALTTVGEIAAIAGLPLDTYSRKFSQMHHITLKSYLDRMIAARAERLLRNPDYTLKDVADMLKFKNEYYFSRFFKRETLNSPGAFRKNQKVCSPPVLFK